MYHPHSLLKITKEQMRDELEHRTREKECQEVNGLLLNFEAN